MASSETFKPGLFGIGLDIEKMSKQDLLISSKQLSYYVKFEPKEIQPLMYNLLAVCLFHMDFGRTKARLRLEELVTEYPQDLNILADLIHVYKQMGCEKDSDRYKKTLNDLKRNKLLQARSILAQANATNYDLTAEYYRTPKVLLEDICLQLNTEDKNLEQVDKAVDMVVDAYEMVNKIPVKVNNEIAIEKFEKGIKMLQELDCSEEEILIWKHNLANVRGKLDTFRGKSDENCESRIENCIKVLETHTDVIENLSSIEEPLKRYVASSYVIFALFYSLRKDWFDTIKLPKRIRRESKDLDCMWQKALSICPDQTVLQRCGRYKLSRNEYLRGIELFSRSIQLVPDIDINWFGYASRSAACYFMSQQKKGWNEDQINYLELAYNDMTLRLKSKCTVRDMIYVANFCVMMAKPNYGKDFRCQNVEYIYEALEIIHEAFKKRGFTECGRIHYHLGVCYSCIGEYRKAIESLKTSLELTKWGRDCSKSFQLLCKCFCFFFNKESTNENLLPEFRYMLKEAKGKQCDKWVTDAIKSLCKYNPKMLADLIGNMIEWDVRGCDVLIDEALYMYTSVNVQESRNLGRIFETKLQRRDREKESNITGRTEIQKSLTTKNLRYDFYISHSEEDKDWVNCMLVPQLEEFDDEMKFRGFIPSRDFVPGQQKIDSMIEGIKQSSKLLIVLTPKYLTDKWQKYARDQMIFSLFERKAREKTIIPIILEACEIPPLIQTLTPISFMWKSEWARLRRGLTVNMDPKRRLEFL